MKNILVIDGADNCVYDIFAAPQEVFDLVFASGTDVAFAEEGDEGHPDLDVLADDDAFDVGNDALGRLLDVLHHVMFESLVWSGAR